MPSSRTMWPAALPTALVAVLLVVPVAGRPPGWLGRLAYVATGEPLAPAHALVLAPALLLTARGLLLRRRVALMGILVVVLFGLTAIIAGGDPPWRLPVLAAAAGALWRFRDECVVRPHPDRVRAAAWLGAAMISVSAGLCIFVGGVSVGSVGHELIRGLGGISPEIDGSPGLARALEVFGGSGVLMILAVLFAPAPPPPPGGGLERARVAELVALPGSDTLAPFALRHDKSYVFSPDGRAAIGFRVLFGVAVAGADPVGDPESHAAAAREFRALCLRMGWAPAVLGARADRLGAWPGMRSIGFGDEVLVRPTGFVLEGRRMRNVRQAVRRTWNAGLTTRVLAEPALPEELRERLRAVAAAALGGAAERGFSMNLDGLLTGEHPGCLIAVAYDPAGAPVAFHRYAGSGDGLSLDAMRRAPDAPNGVNERLIVEVIDHAREHHVPVVSLNFAAFRELLDKTDRRAWERIGRGALHLLDPLIKVESLYLFDRKFQPSYRPRSVVLPSWPALIRVAVALLLLEFARVRPAAAAAGEPVPQAERSFEQS